jgi:hypothetical protein
MRWVLILTGLAFSLSGWGAVLGVPLILIGLSIKPAEKPEKPTEKPEPPDFSKFDSPYPFNPYSPPKAEPVLQDDDEAEPSGSGVWGMPDIRLSFRYVDASGKPSERTVTVRKFLDFKQPMVWGLCEFRGKSRTFKLESMTQVVDCETGEILAADALYDYFWERTSERGYAMRDKVYEMLDFIPIAEMGGEQLEKLEQAAKQVIVAYVSESTKAGMALILAEIAMKRKQPDEAIQHLLPQAQNAQVLRRLGEIEEGRKNDRQALVYYEQALAINPKVGVKRRVAVLKEYLARC